ncbi:MAG: four helix bundle protein [Cyclobacteriaceae bacterium]|nr:four helix bundle protein [Cyclobacteriaceae bacterium]
MSNQINRLLDHQTHKDLDVWKLGIDLVEKVYSATSKFPKEELFGLASQMRKASISFPSNIAEGYARNGKKELIQFLYIALGSLSELETQVFIAGKLSFMDTTEALSDIEQIRRKTLNLIKYHKSKLT